MIYGDNPRQIAERKDHLGLNIYTYAPDINAMRQSGNLYGYAGNNPLMFIDPMGEAWYHWVISGLIVAGAAAAVIAISVTTFGLGTVALTTALYSVCAVASGTAAATTGLTIAAGAFIGSSVAFGTAAFMAAGNSKNIGEFYAQGNWGTVAFTVGGAIAGMAYGNSFNNNKNVAAQNLNFKSFSSGNFRDNLKILTGNAGTNLQAHHVLPQKFESLFSKAGLNINDPMFGAWVGSNHQSWSNAYNQAWQTFFNTVNNPTAAQILSKAAELAKQYGFDVMFNK